MYFYSQQIEQQQQQILGMLIHLEMHGVTGYLILTRFQVPQVQLILLVVCYWTLMFQQLIHQQI